MVASTYRPQNKSFGSEKDKELVSRNSIVDLIGIRLIPDGFLVNDPE